MKFSEQWLREWVNPAVSTSVLAEQLTMAGLEVEAVEPVAAEFTGVAVGEVLSVEPHPDADKLRVCQVSIGGGEPLGIVCGAANVRSGLRVPTAVVGAELPGGLKIKAAKLRGVPSAGMLCSAKELGLAESSEGLLELPADAPVGEDLRKYLELDDVSIELGLTPNRGDCLSLWGVAREVGVLNRAELNVPAIEPVPGAVDDTRSVTLEAPEDCPHYVGRVIRGVDPAAATPLWMQERLRRSGLRSLGPLVDVTNYVLLELGQPMHAFDLTRLTDGIVVRHARAGEGLTLLDGQAIELEAGSLVIADGAGPQALAGIMGGEASAVGDATRDIFLESAYFRPEAIAGRARGYGLHTDSSHRFERGVRPGLQGVAMERATALILAICGGRAGPLVRANADDQMPRPTRIHLRAARIERVLGEAIPDAEVTDILERLGLEVAPAADGWQATPPPFRFDLALEVDLIEELARVHGYGRLESCRPVGRLAIGARPEARVGLSRLRQVLVDRGYQEAITYSFVEPGLQALLDPGAEALPLANPLSADLAVMRTTLWAGLLPALVHNLNRQQERVRLFETGLRFRSQANELKQEMMMAGVVSGRRYPEQWGLPSEAVDFFDVKGDVEALLALTGRGANYIFSKEKHPALHPGQSAAIHRDGEPVGWIGALHPAIERELGLPQKAILFELELAALEQGHIPAFQALSKYPAIRRDISIVVDEEVSAQQVHDCIAAEAPEALRQVQLFDMYVGKGIDSGRKSLSLGLTLQDLSRTLTDNDVDNVIETIINALRTSLGAALRE